MNKFLLALLGFFGCSMVDLDAQLVAEFTAAECAKEYYRQGFDSDVEMEGWNIHSTDKSYTWHLDNPKKTGIPDFQSINPSSSFSMAVFYSQNGQDEVLNSPDFLIWPDSYCSFYACFDGVFVMWANFTVEVVDLESQERTMLFDAFSWSQVNGHERPKWLPFSFDLKEYSNRRVRFVFTYEGSDGDDVLLDDFRIFSKSSDEDAKAEVTEGTEVHLEDLSTGNPQTWEWMFEGGEPSVSSDRNPVITYNNAGSYAVKLTVKNGSGSHSLAKEDFVVVRAVAPVAKIKLPPGGYFSPYAGYFLPVDKEVNFVDISLHRPTEWLWNLPGSSSNTSSEQSPVVAYLKEGVYDISLKVSNVAGEDITEYKKYIQAGGTQYIWNIEADESDKIGSVSLGWYGYYGGTNWLGMIGFAELFDKPAVEGSISEVSVFFDKTFTVTPDTLITLSIAKATGGLPGDVMATTSVSARDLKYDKEQWLATNFIFNDPVEITDSFFVVIAGLPNRSDESGTDDIAIAATTTRSKDGKSTVYHLLEEWDDQDHPTGKSQWLKNTDEFLSFVIAPELTFKKFDSNVEDRLYLNDSFVYWNKSDNLLYVEKAERFERISVFRMDGTLIYDNPLVAGTIDTHLWSRGTYIIKLYGKGFRGVRKVILE